MYWSLTFVNLIAATLLLSSSTPVRAADSPFAISHPAEATLAQAPTPTVEQRVTEAVYLNQQGYDLYRQGQAREALQTFEQALAIFREVGARGGEGNSLNYIGEVYLALGEYDKAMESFQQALVIFKELGKLPDGDRSYEGYTLQYIGEVHDKKAQYDRALESYQQALAIFKTLLNSSARDRDSLLTSQRYTLNGIGAVYFKQGEYPKALEAYQQTLPIHKEQTDRIGEAQTLNNIGVVYANLSQYAQALDAYQQALAIVRSLCCYRGDEAAILNNMASLFFSLGQPTQALNFAQQSSDIYKKLRGEEYKGLNSTEIELLHDALGQSSLNPSFVSQRLAIRAEVGNVLNAEAIVRAGEAVNLNNIGQIYTNQGQHDKALALYQQALAIYKENGNRLGEGISLNNIGQAYNNLGQYDRALDFNQQALAIYKEVGDKAGIGVALSNLGNVCEKQNKSSEALKFYQQALEMHREIGDKSSEGIALRNIGSVLLQTGKPSEASATLQKAVEVLESLRPGLSDANKVSIFETQSLTYRILQQALIAQNKSDDALEIAERGRARAFVELLARRVADRGADSRTSQPVTIKPPTIAQIKQIASAHKATLVEYSLISDRELYIWVVKPTGEVAFRKVNQDKVGDLGLGTGEGSATEASRNTRLANQVIETRNAIFSPVRTRATEKLQQLHQLLIQPIADLLPAQPESRVIFIPQRELFLVPFPALLDANGSYLIEKHTILTAPAIQVLDLTRQQRQKIQQSASQSALIVGVPRNILLIGNPQMPKLALRFGEPPQPLNPLPGAETEAKAIATLLNVPALTGNQATKATVMQQISEARLVHLATHGLLQDIDGTGIPGAIALAPSGTDNGLLTSSEILNLKLKAELVVLSACDTGRGRITGDGVIGLSRSFISAGTPSLIVSLWPVPDDPTAFLMPEFYRQLQQTADKAQALRNAMLATMKQYPAPNNWAAFTLIGEAE